MADTTTIADFVRDAETGNITIRQGKSVSWAYVLLDALNAPLDITGWTARMQVRSSFDSNKVLLSLTTANSKIVNGGVTGQLTNNILPIDTAYGVGTGIKITGESLECVYDYEIAKPDGTVMCSDSGTFTILREVTRDL